MSDSTSMPAPPPPPPAPSSSSDSAPAAAAADVVDAEAAISKTEQVTIEKQQEKILKAKYPQNRGPMSALGGGGGGFLQKRLAKGQKYFDSGDYQMAKQQKGRPGPPRMGLTMPVLAQPSTGDTIPTPDLVPHRKTSIIQPLHDHTMAMHLPSDPAHLASSLEPGRSIPNPINRLAL